MNPMNNQNVIHTAVTTVAHAVLESHGVPREDIEDSLADVTVRMIEAAEAGVAPTSMHGWRKLAEKTAARYAREERGLRPVGEAEHLDFGADEGDDDDGDGESARGFDAIIGALLDQPGHPDRTQAQIALLLDMLARGEMPELAKEILAQLGDGKKVPAIARALGITADDVRARLRRTRTRFFRRLAAVDGFTTAVLDEVDDAAMDDAETSEPSR